MKNLYTIIFCLFFFSIQAQNYYYNGNEKIEIHKSEKSFISYEPTQTFAKGFKKVKSFSTKGFTILEDNNANFSAKEFSRQKTNQTIPALLLDAGSEFKIFPTKTVRVKLKSNIKKEDIINLIEKKDILSTDDKYGILRIKIKDIHKTVLIANKIYESGLVEFSIPDFYIPMVLNQVNDPIFPQQFQMHNTGQNIDGINGVNNIDCNALEAWNINLGDNVTVAVLDEGLENHEDFDNRLIGGFTPATNGNGTPLLNDATHGMNSAGIISASDNNIGIRGVAPNTNLLSVNIFADGTTTADIADGIQWALANGADVISNSWGFRGVTCGFVNIDIDNAILNAVTNGRNGRGALVVFAAGNLGGCVEYPASNANVISVGAVDNRGNLFNYSARGPELDLVAPSGLRFGDVGVRTLDRMGIAGDNNGNYRNDFDGTSAACPVVSGVAALILSMNPNLTQQEVRDILINTATDMGANGFDNNFGFGRVNALAALEEVLLADIEIIGSSTVCTTNSSYTFSETINEQFTWQVSNNLQIVSQSQTSITIKATNGFVSGVGFVNAIFPNRVITKELWVGRPQKPNNVLLYPNSPCVNQLIIAVAYSDYPYIQDITYGWSGIGSYTSQNPRNSEIHFTTNAPNPYTDTIFITASNACGESFQFSKTFSVSNCGGGGGGGPAPLPVSIELKKEVLVYPNPVSNELNILFNNYNNKILALYTLSGQIVLNQLATESKITLILNHLPNGMYFLKIDGENSVTEKIVIQH